MSTICVVKYDLLFQSVESFVSRRAQMLHNIGKIYAEDTCKSGIALVSWPGILYSSYTGSENMKWRSDCRNFNEVYESMQYEKSAQTSL